MLLRGTCDAVTTGGNATSRPRRAIAVLGSAVAVACLSGCVPNVTGPARTFGTYQHKAAATAGAAASSVATTRLAAIAGRDGDAFLPYLSVVTSDAEDSLGAVSTTFDAILPPGARAERLRAQLGDLLEQAGDDVSATRIAIRRGELDRSSALIDDLARDTQALLDFEERHQ